MSSIVRWNDEEEMAFLRYWASIDRKLTLEKFKLVAITEGHGYRIRPNWVANYSNGWVAWKRLQEVAKKLPPLAAPTPAPTPAPSLAPAPPPLKVEQPPMQSIEIQVRFYIPTSPLSALIEGAITRSLAGVMNQLETALKKQPPTSPAADLAPVLKDLQAAIERLVPPEKMVIPLVEAMRKEKHNPESFSAPRPETKQVLLIGALPIQSEAVQAAFPSIDVRGFKDTMPNEQDPDLVLLMTKFTSHSHQDTVYKKYPKEILSRVNGGVDSMKAEITAKLGVQPKENGK